jgi:hypothetical protein
VHRLEREAEPLAAPPGARDEVLRVEGRETGGVARIGAAPVLPADGAARRALDERDPGAPLPRGDGLEELGVGVAALPLPPPPVDPERPHPAARLEVEGIRLSRRRGRRGEDEPPVL